MQTETTETPPPSLRFPGKWLISLVCLTILLAALKWSAPVCLPVAMAFFLAILNFPLKEWLNRVGLHPLLSLFLVMLLNMGAVVGVGALGTSLVGSVQQRLPNYIEAVRLKLETTADWLEKHHVEGAVETVRALDWGAIWKFASEKGWLDSAAMAGTDAVRFVINFGKDMMLTFLLMAFILLEATQMPNRLSVVRNAGGPDLSYLMRIAGDIQKYIGIKTAISAATGILAGLLCYFTGLEYAVFWGLVAFFLNFIPVIGSIVAAIPPTIIALVMLGPVQGIVIVAGYLSINQLLGSFIEPMIMGMRFGVSTLVIFLSVVLWGFIWGPIGMFLAVPITMVLKVTLDNSSEWRWLSLAMSKQEIKNSDLMVADLLEDLEDDEQTLGAGATTESPRR